MSSMRTIGWFRNHIHDVLLLVSSLCSIDKSYGLELQRAQTRQVSQTELVCHILCRPLRSSFYRSPYEIKLKGQKMAKTAPEIQLR